MNSFTNGFPVPPDRLKPWGTAHAVLCAKDIIKEPFAVINADDFYGRNAFQKAHHFLMNECNKDTYAIIGYDLLKTLSAHGTVNRGVCEIDSRMNLVSITERINISLKNKKIICDDDKAPNELPLTMKVSMNFWCFHPSVFPFTQKMFQQFLAKNSSRPKAEFFIPIVADQFISEGGVIKLIPTTAQWFGVTYKEDAPEVKKNLFELAESMEYPQRFWE